MVVILFLPLQSLPYLVTQIVILAKFCSEILSSFVYGLAIIRLRLSMLVRMNLFKNIALQNSAYSINYSSLRIKLGNGVVRY